MKSTIFQTSFRVLLTAVLLVTTVLVQMPTQAYAQSEANVTYGPTGAECGALTTYSATGNDADAIRGDVNAFRDAIGELNAFEPVNNLDGRRQINWDAAPDAVSAANPFPGDFFNFNAAPRARGIEFTTPGTEFQLSATQASGVGIEFDNVDPSYSSEFNFYSPERIFAPIGSNVTDVRFYSPADQTTPASVKSFGVIFTDVDLADVTNMRFYDAQDNLIYTLNVAATPGSEGLTLAGVQYDLPCIYRVRITTGNIGLNTGVTETPGNGYDLVAMDDIIYGEPLPITSCGLPSVYEGTGSNPDEIRPDINAYRDALGTLNDPAPFNNPDGRRQINWDAAPDFVSAPNSFPGNFFNADVFPRARGIAFSTEGTDFQLSATQESGEGIEFDNINPNYSSLFQTYSPQRLFTAIDSNVVRADFYNPAQQTTRAYTDGFGAVFTDVDLENKTTIAYYDKDGKLLYKQAVKALAGDEGLSFAGLKFDSSCVYFVKLTNGTAALGADVNEVIDDNNKIDLVVMDDFIYGEPLAETVCGLPEVYTTTGDNADAVRDTINAYRDALGELNPFEPQNFPDGRRQINWDAAPDAVSAPNPFAGDFFNFNAAPRARGIEFTTNGEGFQLSATAASGEGIEFDNIDDSYAETFNVYSPERLFTAIGSNELDARFFDPATQTGSALTTGFGAVFSDVDLANVTALRYYDADNKLVYAQSIPAVTGEEGVNVQESLSFAGVKFNEACVARVRLVNGNTPIEAGVQDDPKNVEEAIDLVVMDDFIYGEPQPTAINVNAAINLTKARILFSSRPRQNAPKGVLKIRATFKNVGDENIKDLSFVVTELSRGNVLLNAENGVQGAGARLSVPAEDLGEDGLLTPGETFKVNFEIGLNRLRAFTFLVNAFGAVGTGDVTAQSLGWNYQVDVNPASADQEQSVYLPLVVR